MIFYEEVDFGTPEFDEALKIRYEVLRAPLGLDYKAEDIAQEYQEHCICCFIDDEIKGVLQLKIEGHRAKMRQVAVTENLRNQNIGSGLVKAAEKKAKEFGCEWIYCHAREQAINFYLKLNYSINKDPFEEVGIPHRYMEKKLN